MTTLVSPGVQTQIIDQSFFVPGRQSSVPLFFIATADEKFQEDGITPAQGTYESGVVRAVTSVSQALQLYGIPKFYTSADGLAHHGDARNEYGLDGLIKYLEVANLAYVIRANVNLNDNYADIKAMWQGKIADAADELSLLVSEYISVYNATFGYVPADVEYKVTVTKAELTELVNQVLQPILSSYSFSSDLFALRFLRDATLTYAGYQDIVFQTSGGQIQTTDITGVEDDTTVYGAQIRVVHSGGNDIFNINLEGRNIQTFGNLITEIESAFAGAATVELVAGRIRITSTLTGATSAVEILSDGPSGTLPLFASLNLFREIAEAIPGEGPNGLNIYDDDFTTILGSYEGLYGAINSWNSGAIITADFTANEAATILEGAASDFDNTKEFIAETSLGSNDATRRAEIVKALQAEVNNPTSGIRGDQFEYNLVVCPGYFEVTDELLRLSTDLQNEVFVIGETPFDKPPTGPNGIDSWAATPARVSSPYVAYYYAHGLSSNVDGATILTTAASTALRTFAFNDQEGEVWFAPAGTQRGRCDHLTTIGYVSGVLGTPTTFVEDYLDQGTRDVLYKFPTNINPITFIPGRGILVFGQRTTSPATSALSSVNVARLVAFIRRELRKGMFSFLFEPNDKITRDQVKAAAVGFLSSLLDRRGLYDFAVQVDETNNTPDRIDRNELWINIAIKPVRAIEFIYIPIRVVRTDAEI